MLNWMMVVLSGIAMLLAGCASTSGVRIEGGRMEIIVADHQAGSRIKPGTVVALEVRITDAEGKQATTRDNSLGWVDLAVSGTNAKVGGAGQSIEFLADRAGFVGDAYQITVFHKKFPKVRQQIALRPDWAAVLGPDPENVRSLKFALPEAPDGTPLIPLNPYKVVVEVVDDEGRIFSTDPAPGVSSGLPLDRLVIARSNLEFDAQRMVVQGAMDEIKVNAEGYTLKVAYRGRPEMAQERRFAADLAALIGPDPANVAELRLDPVTSDVKTAVPGTEVTFKLSVVDKAGRAYYFPRQANKPTFLSNRLRVLGENLRFDDKKSVLLLRDSYQQMVGKRYRMIAVYEGRDDLPLVHVIEPDMLSGLPLMSEGALDFVGTSGVHGRDGTNGSGGAYGNTNPHGIGGSGASGTDGTSGGHGRNGQHGPAIQVLAHEVRTVDGRNRLALIEVTGPGMVPKYFLRPLAAGPLQITSQGGKGGNGGAGGDGGDGARGGDGRVGGGSGGSGGRGGNGGNGGTGGNGGRVMVLVSNTDLESVFVPLSRAGEGGLGGDGGKGGRGGSAGLILATAKEIDSKGLAASTGSEGSNGSNGSFGMPGNQGNDGSVEIRLEGRAADVVRRAPNSLTRNVLF